MGVKWAWAVCQQRCLRKRIVYGNDQLFPKQLNVKDPHTEGIDFVSLKTARKDVMII